MMTTPPYKLENEWTHFHSVIRVWVYKQTRPYKQYKEQLIMIGKAPQENARLKFSGWREKYEIWFDTELT